MGERGRRREDIHIRGHKEAQRQDVQLLRSQGHREGRLRPSGPEELLPVLDSHNRAPQDGGRPCSRDVHAQAPRHRLPHQGGGDQGCRGDHPDRRVGLVRRGGDDQDPRLQVHSRREEGGVARLRFRDAGVPGGMGEGPHPQDGQVPHVFHVGDVGQPQDGRPRPDVSARAHAPREALASDRPRRDTLDRGGHRMG